MGQRLFGTCGNAFLVIWVVAGLSACAERGGLKDNSAWVQDRVRTIHLPTIVSIPPEAEPIQAGTGQKGGFKTDVAGAVRRAVEREIVQRGLFSIVQPSTPADVELMLSVGGYGVGEMQAGTFYALLDVTATLMQDGKSALWTSRESVSISDRYKAGQSKPVVPPDTSTVLQTGLERAAARVATALFADFGTRVVARASSAEVAPGNSARVEVGRKLVREKTLPGELAYHAETLAKDANCRGPDGRRPEAALIGTATALEVYSVSCADREAMLVRCEYRVCSIASDLASDASVHDQSKTAP